MGNEDDVYYVYSVAGREIIYEAPEWDAAEKYRLSITCPEHYGVLSKKICQKEGILR